MLYLFIFICILGIVEAGRSEIGGAASRLQTQAGFLCYNLEAEFLLQETCFCSQGLQLIR